jgi:hypothetical protein
MHNINREAGVYNKDQGVIITERGLLLSVRVESSYSSDQLNLS